MDEEKQEDTFSFTYSSLYKAFSLLGAVEKMQPEKMPAAGQLLSVVSQSVLDAPVLTNVVSVEWTQGKTGGWEEFSEEADRLAMAGSNTMEGKIMLESKRRGHKAAE